MENFKNNVGPLMYMYIRVRGAKLFKLTIINVVKIMQIFWKKIYKKIIEEVPVKQIFTISPGNFAGIWCLIMFIDIISSCCIFHLIMFIVLYVNYLVIIDYLQVSQTDQLLCLLINGMSACALFISSRLDICFPF